MKTGRKILITAILSLSAAAGRRPGRRPGRRHLRGGSGCPVAGHALLRMIVRYFWPGLEDMPPPWMSSLTRPAFIRVSEEDLAEWTAALAGDRDGADEPETAP